MSDNGNQEVVHLGGCFCGNIRYQFFCNCPISLLNYFYQSTEPLRWGMGGESLSRRNVMIPGGSFVMGGDCLNYPEERSAAAVRVDRFCTLDFA